jgi:hypothetical protein
MSMQTPSTRAPDRPTADIRNAPTREMQNFPAADGRREPPMPRPGNETKPAYRTTELYIYLAAVGATLLASELVGVNAQGVDPFQANNAWWFITLLTIAYLGSRGLAKLATSWRRSGDNR